ncbi:MAG: hypothetical protein NXI00_21200 [Cytophagales bacterium]|nr:hypothetical protein [Cytophagales bacterium]
MKAEELLSKYPSVKIGLDDHYGKQTVLKAINEALGQKEQLKAFADYAQNRMWEDGDKDLSEFVDEFLNL